MKSRYPKPFDAAKGLNAVLGEIAEAEGKHNEAARQWTQAAKYSDNPEQCLERARWNTELAFHERTNRTFY